jgi:glycosyltransferase involved in cell wall biosynthesis
MHLKITIIVCTHNPRFEYLDRVLDSLKAQTLSKEEWELVLVDNASVQKLSDHIDVSWHPYYRYIREDQLGLTHARLRGIKEAQSEILVFVDDDNVLDSNYLDMVLKIDRKWPILGAWGGQIFPEFEEAPPDWTKPYWGYLAIREFNQDKWSNLLHQHEITPFGAGLCIRRIVAEKYSDLVRNDPKRINLDRKGNLMLSGGDIDLACTSCDIGLGMGLFTSLKLIHLMPAVRLSEEYLLKIVEGSTYSQVILDSLRDKTPVKRSFYSETLLQIRRWLMKPRARRFHDAYFRGFNLAMNELLTLSDNQAVENLKFQSNRVQT